MQEFPASHVPKRFRMKSLTQKTALGLYAIVYGGAMLSGQQISQHPCNNLDDALFCETR
jgi:hypothetical protein